MNVDEARIRHYFTSQSATIDLASGDPSTIAARAGARRRRRRSVGTGVVALTLVAAALGVQQRGTDDGQVTADAPAPASADPLQWTTVVPQAGLSGAASVVSSDGTMFGLSTAPGRHVPDDSAVFDHTLYRSADGVEWSTVPLPANLSPSQLALDGDQLYAVGTAPAGGGGRSLVLARSSAASSSAGEWSQVDLPLDLAPLDARYGDGLSVNGLSVAAGADGVVASVNLQVWVDPESVVPDSVDVSGGWSWTAEGVVVYTPGECADASVSSRVREECAAVARAGLPTVEASGRAGGTEIAASFTWEQLGIDRDLRSLIQGELRVFASSDGVTFEEVALPAGATGASTVVATREGFVLFAQTWPQDSGVGQVQVLRSSDGRQWSSDPSATFTGYLDAAGRVGGRAAAVTISPSTESRSTATIAHVEQGNGSWSSLDLSRAVHAPEGSIVSGTSSAVGPMGVAVWAWAYDPEKDDGPTGQYVVFTPDGIHATAVDVTDEVGRGFSSGIIVSADAVFAGYSVPRTATTAAPRMGLLVGTPG